MALEQVKDVLKNLEFFFSELLDALDSSCREYGYIKAMALANFRNDKKA